MKEKIPISPFAKVIAIFFSLLGIITIVLMGVFLFNSFQNILEKKRL
ncbi:hypothetical protein [Bacillus sp. JJ722]